jgi:hypothetical protein
VKQGAFLQAKQAERPFFYVDEIVMAAKAAIQADFLPLAISDWIPACAGMTGW